MNILAVEFDRLPAVLEGYKIGYKINEKMYIVKSKSVCRKKRVTGSFITYLLNMRRYFKKI